MADPVPAITYAVIFATFTAVIFSGTASAIVLAECDDFDDLLEGDCADLVSELFDVVAIGTIPGAPLEINVFYGAIGLSCRLVLVVWLINQGGWVAIVGLVATGVTALVAWLN